MEVRLGRLAKLIEPAGTERVLQVYGPTGLGKTTLIANYALARGAVQRQFRWLGLHPAHLRDEDAFRQTLAEALGHPGETAFDRIRAVLRGRGDQVLVVDAGALEPGPLGKVLGELVHWTGTELQVWLISRRPMRRCWPNCARRISCARSIPGRCCSMRMRCWARASRKGGRWPRRSSQRCHRGSGRRPAARSCRGLLEAAIREGIWQGLSATTRDLLAQTAMLERVDARLLPHIAAPLPAYPVLDEIATLAPLGQVRRGAGGGFSLHPLLRAFALRQLERGEPARRDRAYRQALLHHAERRAPEAAIALVQDTGDHGLARMAFETFTSTELLRASGYNRLRSAMAQLSPEAAEQSGQIRITQAVVAMKEGRFPEARRLLESAREMLSEDMAYQSPSLSRVYTDFVIAQHVLAFHAHTELTEAQLSEGYFWSTYTNDLTNAAFVYALRSLHYLRRGDRAGPGPDRDFPRQV
ncbi:AAA family ATPase [Novosphingobium resinovorum]